MYNFHMINEEEFDILEKLSKYKYEDSNYLIAVYMCDDKYKQYLKNLKEEIMNSKKIDESIKLFQEIKDLDEKILSIERMAKLAANNNIEARLGLGIRDLNKDSTSKI